MGIREYFGVNFVREDLGRHVGDRAAVLGEVLERGVGLELCAEAEVHDLEAAQVRAVAQQDVL